MPEIDPEQSLSCLFFLLRCSNPSSFGSERTPERDLFEGGEQPYVHFLFDIYHWPSLTACRYALVGQFES